MARWEIFTEASGNVRVQYVVLQSRRQVFLCGVVRPDTPVELLIDFVVLRGDAQPLDLICFADTGVVVPVLPPASGIA
jgi:hypothetical protein